MPHSFLAAFLVFAAQAQQPPPTPQVDPASAAWNAAAALKAKADYRGAAAVWEAFGAQFPESPRIVEAQVEAGVCWFSAGREAQVLHRNTPEAVVRFDKALALFERVTTEQPTNPLSTRAQYMKGSTHLFSGELEQAEADYSAALERFNVDKNFAGKALERRAFVRRQRLDVKGALADLERWKKEVNDARVQASVTTAVELASICDKNAPMFQAELWLQGEDTPLETLGGQVVALYFFASWCPNCAKELPFVLDLEKRFAAKGVKFIGVVDQSKGQTAESMRAFLKRAGITFAVLMDNGQSGVAYKAATIPHVALIDRDGKLRWCDNPAVLNDGTVDLLLNEGGGDHRAVAPPQAPVAPQPPAQNPPPAQSPPAVDPSIAAWDAALALKAKNEDFAAAAAFDDFFARYPDSPKRIDALVEAGVCWFSHGRDVQQLHRNTPETSANFARASVYFERVLKDHATQKQASRAQYMKATAALFSGELAKAEAGFSAVLTTFNVDPEYVGKALERRATVRRQRLDIAGAIEDLMRWQKDVKVPAASADSIARYLQLAKLCEKPAPLLRPESWLQGQPALLETQRGKVVCLFFFASWCPNCPAELPFIVDLQRRYGARGLTLIGCTNHNKDQTTEQMREYLKKQDLPIAVMIDNGQASLAYKASSIPFMALIDREGKLRWCDTPTNLTDWTIEQLLNDGAAAKGAAK